MNWSKFRKTALFCIFSFYCGCGITLSFLKFDCADAITKKTLGVDPIIIQELIEREHLNVVSHEFDRVEYAVLILSGPDNVARRDTIRTTWMKLASNLIVENGERIYRWNLTGNNHTKNPEFMRFYFVIGTKLLNSEQTAKLVSENARTKDLLLLENLGDSYKNLSEKMLLALEWFSKNMKNLKYLLKCDDDSFLRVDLIIKDLEAFGPEMNTPEISEYLSVKESAAETKTKGLYWGYFNGRANVYLKGKWKENDWFLCDKYLPYALGGGYVISKNIVNYIGRNHDFLSPYHSEDVSMGVWTSALKGIKRIHDIRFDTEWKSRGCSNKALVRHKQTTADMFEMYKTLLKTKGVVLCAKETVDRYTYVYNWDVLPSNCCKLIVG